VAFTHGQGCLLFDEQGRRYLDGLAGIAVNTLGHNHPRLVGALSQQIARLIHVSNVYRVAEQEALADRLAGLSGMDEVFFCNSGCEANEAAIKLARKYAHEKMGEGRYELITMKDSFHGRTMATITATGQEKFQFGFTPLLDGFTYVPFNDPGALEAAITPKTCGVMLEPIQGEGGVIIPDAAYLARVRDICDRHHILMIVDEVQTGVGRTGRLFAYEHSGIEPDIMTLAKALGNGFPVGAMLAKEEIARAFVPGNHASTFGGNLLAMAAVKATLKALLEDGVLDNCRKIGEYFLLRLRELQAKHPVITEVRGRGLMLACSLAIEGAGIVGACQERGLLINCTGGKTLRFVPPLIVDAGDIDEAIAILDSVMEGT
jgi:predicted acetylornithine/succinylornithine family transaminase